MLTTKEIEKITNELKKNIPNLLGIYLFGSEADGTATAESDVDLAFYAPKQINSLGRFKLQNELACILNRDVDLIDLDATNLVFKTQIIYYGKRIYSANDYKLDLLETHTISDYAAFSELRQPIIDDIQKRGSIYG